MSQTPRSVSDLFQRYLRGQTTAHGEGLGFADLEGQVAPYENVPIQPVDPRLAWDGALAVLPHFSEQHAPTDWPAPPDWPSLVALQEPTASLAFCVGNFPQLVRHLQPLLDVRDVQALCPTRGWLVSISPALLQWTKEARDYPGVFLAIAVLRLARHFDEAAELLRGQGRVPAVWQALRANEAAALDWHQGRAEEALTAWQAQKPSVPVLFNRGMASLFLGDYAAARRATLAAIDSLPDTSAWHHLGRLYLTLAETRG